MKGLIIVRPSLELKPFQFSIAMTKVAVEHSNFVRSKHLAQMSSIVCFFGFTSARFANPKQTKTRLIVWCMEFPDRLNLLGSAGKN